VQFAKDNTPKHFLIMGWRSEWDDEPERFRVRDVNTNADNVQEMNTKNGPVFNECILNGFGGVNLYKLCSWKSINTYTIGTHTHKFPYDKLLKES